MGRRAGDQGAGRLTDCVRLTERSTGAHASRRSRARPCRYPGPGLCRRPVRPCPQRVRRRALHRQFVSLRPEVGQALPQHRGPQGDDRVRERGAFRERVACRLARLHGTPQASAQARTRGHGHRRQAGHLRDRHGDEHRRPHVPRARARGRRPVRARHRRAHRGRPPLHRLDLAHVRARDGLPPRCGVPARVGAGPRADARRVRPGRRRAGGPDATPPAGKVGFFKQDGVTVVAAQRWTAAASSSAARATSSPPTCHTPSPPGTEFSACSQCDPSGLYAPHRCSVHVRARHHPLPRPAGPRARHGAGC